MHYFDSHFVFAYILNCSTLTKFQLSFWSSAMPKETESIKKKLNTSKQGKALNLGLAAGLLYVLYSAKIVQMSSIKICICICIILEFYLFFPPLIDLNCQIII